MKENISSKPSAKERSEVEILLEDVELLEHYIEEISTFFPLPLCFVGLKGAVIETNQVFDKTVGLAEKAMVGRSIEEIFKKKEAETLISMTLKEGGIEGKEFTLKSPKGQEFPVNVFTKLRKDEKGNSLGFFLSFFDLRATKKIQASLEEKVNEIQEKREFLEQSQKALMNILEDVEETRKKVEEERDKTQAIIISLADGLLVFDSENKLSLINPQAEAFFQIKGTELVGKSISQLKEVALLKPLIELLGEEVKKIFREELSLRENLVLEVSTLPIMREKEKMGSLVILHDITREKTVERLKTEFVSLAAHQLRTPLSAMKWVLRLFLDGDLGEITDEQKTYLEKAYQENEIMISLINDLLDVARIEEGRYITKTSLVQFEKICQEIGNSFQSQFWQKGINFGLILPSQPLAKVKVDVEKMKLAIQNLVDNSLKYTPPGGQVTISLKPGIKEIGFEIKDTGVGIPEEQKKRVFSKFFRGKNILRMETTGTGLGLFITKNIIEAHGGKIWFDSTEGKGTTFYFTLPVEK